MSTTVELVRANKVTAYWEGDGVAIGNFYKTHDKLKSIRSDEAEVLQAGFTMPDGEDVTAQQRLKAFKDFLSINASTFGIQFDPVDRRSDEFKFPNKYDDSNFGEFSKKILENAVVAAIDKVNANVVPGLVKAGLLVEGTEVAYDVADGEVEVKESYNNGSIKYGIANYPVMIGVGGLTTTVNATVSLVSGQLKKPKTMGDVALTQTGIKTFLTDAGILPKVEKKTKEEEVANEEAVVENGEVAVENDAE